MPSVSPVRILLWLSILRRAGRVPNAEFIKTSVGEVAGTCVWRLTAVFTGPLSGELSPVRLQLTVVEFDYAIG